MPIRLFALIFLLLGGARANAQIGGRHSFAFLDLPPTAAVSALGGATTAAPHGLGFWQYNPALADSASAGVLSLGYLPWFADIRQLQLGYAQPFKGGYLLGGVQYLSYGQLEGYDPSGAPEGRFSASDWAISGGYTHQFGPFAAGGLLRWASSGIAGYRASALLLDAGGRFRHPQKDLTVAFLIRNLGAGIGRYAEEVTELPLDVQLGVSYKPQFMPFRFYLQAHHLQQPRLTQGSNKEDVALFAKVLRHVSLGTELVLSRQVQLRLGYNYLRRQELKLPEAAGGAGLSAGLSVGGKRFRFDVSRAWYHAVGGRNQLNLALNMNNLL
ncbi:type IX secretion system protein PorQ [Cesiribacter andamanensis]|uniref:Bacteroidetes-specific membrane protein n=1 Tax=Cesiribacter andamanensis AMV16 TaxID=1279009 RepID=M7NU38_9BACT|nr:type IX secretion system protein PorQ [Cesiribacter andamanensis]EMR02009.1 hypothetical protein ADICEAN_02868 [Cesiribacter andamanensis AMV16]